MPHCPCGNYFLEGEDAYCVKCGFETRASASATAEKDFVPVSEEALRSPGEHMALAFGLGLLGFSWLLFDALTDVVPLLVASVGLVVYALIRQAGAKGAGIMVNPRSFPDVDQLARKAADRLGMKKPELFIRHSPELNAYAVGFPSAPCVVLHSATVHLLRNSPRELQFVVGHEFTHVRRSHLVWQTIAAGNPILGRIPVLNLLMPLFFSWWSRRAEYTADRGGLIACGDLAASQRALARLAIGPELFDRLNMDELMKQAEGDLTTRAGELLSSHPLLAKRLVAMADFARGPLGEALK